MLFRSLSRKPEAFGRTVLEALAVGRPVLGWDHGGVGELLGEWWPQGAVAPFDAQALAGTARACPAQAVAPGVRMPDTLRAMQEATTSLSDELQIGRAPARGTVFQ